MKFRSGTLYNILALSALLLSLIGSGMTVTPAYAAGICYVNDNAGGTNNGTSWTHAYTDLQSAIADSCAEIWVAAGTYKPTTGNDRTLTFTLKNNVGIYGGFAGTETLRTQRNSNPATNGTILSGDLGTPSVVGDNSYHVVTGSGTDNTAVLNGFTITAGNANGASTVPCTQLCGGGMYNDLNSNPYVTNVTFNDNRASDGGGMYNFISSPTLMNVTFSSNSASSLGGGMHNDWNSNPTLTNVTFDTNTASFGGGMHNDRNSNPTLTNVTFSGNSVISGGGMLNAESSPTLTNVTFSGNLASSAGGGMYNSGFSPNFSSPTLKNVIIANNTGGDCILVAGSTVNALSSNSLIKDTGANACGLTNGANGNIIGSNPLLGALADNGGSTKTFALMTGSPALNAGTNTGCPSTDQRGVSRPQNGTCDIGAFESYLQSGPAFVVNSSGDTNGDCEIAPGDCTLREAINTANTIGGTDTITFDLALNTYPITLTSSTQLPAIASTIIINGNGAANTIIQADAAANTASYRVFEVGAGNLTLDSLTVQNGRCDGLCDTNATNGAGIYNGGTLTVTNSIIADNYASNGTGGGIHDAGILTVTNTSFSGNYAGSSGGGGIYIGGNTVEITDSSFTDNHTTNNHGGAIHNVGELTVTNTTFSDNESLGNGGGIYNHALGELDMIDSTMTGNSANQGGGIYNAGALSVTSSTFNANLANGGGSSNGGAIDHEGNNAFITNSTFTGNSANQYGGGLFNSNASAIVITNSTFSGNSADFGGGIFNGVGNNISLKNTILANSPAPTDGDCYNNSGNTIGTNVNNLIETNGSGGYGCGTPLVSADPKLGALQNNGGLTQTILPAFNSPVINMGDNTTCESTDQRGISRPQGLTCDIGAVERVNFGYNSIALNDGWTLESKEFSNVASTLNNSGKLRAGDDALNRQYRSLLFFDTSKIPDNAIISKVMVRIYKSNVTGTDPFTTHGDLVADIKKGFFGLAPLQLTDFNAAAEPINTAGKFKDIGSNWHQLTLSSLNYKYINVFGATQFRIRFVLDDNNNKTANIALFNSGGDPNPPQLIVEYSAP